MEQQDVLKVVLEAVVDWNEQSDVEHQLEVSPDTHLLGHSSKLDSFGLVNLIITIEEKIADKFGQTLTLADERAMSQQHSPFRSVQSLTEYVYMLLIEIENA